MLRWCCRSIEKQADGGAGGGIPEVWMSVMDALVIRSQAVRDVLGHYSSYHRGLRPLERRRAKPREKGWRAVNFSFAGRF